MNALSNCCYTKTLNINPSVNRLLRGLDREMQEIVANDVYGDNSIKKHHKNLDHSQKECKIQEDIGKCSFLMK